MIPYIVYEPPLGAVWDRYCETSGVTDDGGLIDAVTTV